MPRCPNISHPDWKALVAKIGVDRAYMEWMRNGEDIPNPSDFEQLSPEEQNLESYSLPKSQDEESLLLDGFESYHQQQEAVNAVSDSVLVYMKEHPRKITWENSENGEVVDIEPTNKKGFVRKVEDTFLKSAFLDFREQLLGVMESYPEEKKFNILHDNYDAITELVKDKLNNLGLLGTQEETEEDADDLGFDIINADKSYRPDDWVFKFDSKGNALKQVKQFLAFIPRTTYNERVDRYDSVKSYLSVGEELELNSFMPYDQVFEELSAILSDTENTWEAMEKQMLEFQKSKPWIYSLFKNLNDPDFPGDKAQLKNQFVSTMSRAYSNAKTFLWKEQTYYDEIEQRNYSKYYLNIIDTDQASVEKSIKEKWSGGYRASSMLMADADNNLITNPEQVAIALDKIAQLAIDPNQRDITDFFKSIGVTLNPATIRQLIDGKVGGLSLSGQFKEKTGLFVLVKSRLEGKQNVNDEEVLDQEQELVNANNPVVNNSAISSLAKVEALNENYAYSNSYKNGEGSTVYSYTFNKAITRKYRRLMENPEFLQRMLKLTFNKPIIKNGKPIYSNWLNELNTNGSFKSIFKISPFDTIRQSKTGSKAAKLSGMSKLDMEVTQIAMIQNSGATKEGVGRIIKFLQTVPAKTTSYVIQAGGVDVKPIFYKDGSYSLGADAVNALYSIVAAEHNRILSQQARPTNDNYAYDKGSKKFFFFPQFNLGQDSATDAYLYNSDGTIKLPTTIVDGTKTVEDKIKNSIVELVKEEVASKLKAWETLGITKNGILQIVDGNYVNKIVKSRVNDFSQNTLYSALDYYINSTVAKFNAHQAFIGDPALYFKKDIKNTWDNIDKRLAAIVAPGKDLALQSSDDKFISIKLVDREKGNHASNLAQLEKRLEKYYEKAGIELPYRKIDGTDAQEYTTLKEDLYVKYAQGLIPTSVYNNLLSRIDKEGDNLVLTNNELGMVLGATKPVYSDTIIYDDEDYAAEEYVKSSSIALLPQFTKGLQIDKLRKAMESHERDRKTNVRAVFNSGTKVGGKKSINIWNEDGTIKDDLDLTDYGVTLNRSGFSIQQELPWHEDKEEVVKATQPTKQLFDSLLSVQGFRFEGKVYNGSDLRDIYEGLHNDLYSSGLRSLEHLILTNGRLDKAKLQTRLMKEAKGRGYSPSELSFLKLNIDKTDFDIPFWANPSSQKLESLITSMYNNSVLRQKMHGRSYVLTSEEGVGQGVSAGTTYTKSYDAAKGLQPMRLVYRAIDKTLKIGEGTDELEFDQYDKLTKEQKANYREVTKPAQVLLTWNLKGKNGDLLNIEDFKDEDGTIDFAKIPKDLLTQFGFRIPCQGHNSMSLIEVVGFIPESYGDLVVATRNFITQMGSDFDIDKLYMYDYYLNNVEDGKVSKVQNLKNRILDIHKAVMSNPQVFDSTVKPLDLGRLKYEDTSGSSKGIAVELQTKIAPKSYLSPDYSQSKYLQSVDGKAMVGIESLSNTSAVLFQGKDMGLQKLVKDKDGNVYPVPVYIYFRDGDGKDIILSNLSNATTITGRKKTDVNAAYQSAAVDNEKDPILDFINSNPITGGVQTLLRHLGMEEELSLFLAQPSLRKYVELVRSGKSSFSKGRKTDDEILLDLTKQYAGLVTQERLESGELTEDYPISYAEMRYGLSSDKKVPKDSKLTPQELQYITLLKYAKLKAFADVLSRAQGLFNIESKGIGRTLMHVAAKAESITEVTKNPTIRNLAAVLETADVINGVTINTPTISGSAIDNSIIAADNSINRGDLLPFASSAVKAVMKEYAVYSGKPDADASVDDRIDLWKAIRSFTYAQIFTTEERERIFYDRGNNESLNTRIRKLQNTKLKDNDFILRLNLAQVDVTGKKPSYVFYNSAKEENIEELNIYQGFSDLVNSKDPEIKEIGLDLVNYFFINGGDQQSREWGKYISASHLSKIHIADYLRNVNFNNGATFQYINDVLPSGFIRQYFQHNPQLLASPNYSSIEKIVKSKGGETILIPNLFGPSAVRELSSTGVEYNTMISMPNAQSPSGYDVYFRQGFNKEGAAQYKRIPSLGTKFYTEYQLVDDFAFADSLLNKQTVATKDFVPEVLVQEFAALPSPTSQKLNPAIAADIAPMVDNVSLVDALAHVNQDPLFVKYARLFQQLSPILKGVTVKLNNEKKGVEGRYNREFSTIFLNSDSIGTEKFDYERVILVEAVHALIHKISTGGFEATVVQKQAITSIQDIYNGLRAKVLAEESNIWNKDTLKHFDQVYSQMKRYGVEKVSAADNKFLQDNTALYYGISALVDADGHVVESNWEDFLHEAILQPEFMKALNSSQHSQNKSILGRLGDLITRILDEFRSLLSIRPGSKLDETFGNFIKIIEMPTENGIDDAGEENATERYSLRQKQQAAQKEADVNYTKVVNDFKSRIASINKDITKADQSKDRELFGRLRARKLEVQKEMETLIAQKSFDSIVTQGNNDINHVTKILSQDKVSTQDIRYASKVLATWQKVSDPLYGVISHKDIDNQTKRYEEVQALTDKANSLSTRLSSIELGTLYELIKKEAPGLNITREDLSKLKDISGLQAQLRDISTSDNLIASVMSKWIRNANLDAKTEANEIIAELDTILEKLHNNPLFKKDGYQKLFGQVDAQGTYTGELVSALSPEYFNTRDLLLDAARNPPNEVVRKAAWKKYYDWVKENHIILDVRKLFTKEVNGAYTFNPNSDYLASVTNQLGEDGEKVIAQAKEQIAEYNSELELQHLTHGDDPEGFRVIEKWTAENDPSIYMNNLTEGYTKQVVNGEVVYNKGYKYIARRANAIWEDARYNTVQANPDLKAFYDYATNTMQELINYLPYSMREELSPTFIPNINNDLIGTLRDQSIGQGMGTVWSKFLDNISITDPEGTTGVIDPITGKLEKDFKIKYLSQIDPTDKSYDIGKVLKVFAIEALEYKHKSLAEDAVRLGESVINKAYEKQITALGKPVTDKFDQVATFKGLRNLLEQVDYAMEAFYGNRRDKTEGATNKGVVTPVAQRKIDAEIANLPKDQDEIVRKAQIATIIKKHTRYYSFGRIGDTLLQYVQIKGMGWNVFGALNNLTFGYIANNNWAAGRRDFDQDALTRASGIMLSYNKKLEDKVQALMTKFDTVKELNEVANKRTDNNNVSRRGMEKLSPFELYRKGEYFVQGQTMVAMMIHKKIEVTTKTGEKKTVSMWDALDEKGNFNTELYEDQKDWQTKGQKIYDFKNQLDQIIKTIHGNYDPNSPVLMKKKVLGRALLQFRSWIAEGVAARFDSEKYDLMLQRTRKGRFRTLSDLGVKESIRTLAKQMIYRNSDKAFDHLNIEGDQLELVKENMRRNLNELYQKVGLTMLYLVLSNLDIDKDDWKTRLARNYTVNSLMRLSDDIEFYYSPSAFENITRSAIPAATLVVDGNMLLSATWDSILGDGEYKSGARTGQSKFIYRAAKILPFGNAVESTINKGKSQESFRK